MNVIILGGDGYLGWSVGTRLSLKTHHNILMVDNYIKRQWVNETDTMALLSVKLPRSRISEFKNITGVSNIGFSEVDATDFQAISALLNIFQPDIILNFAQQPSAPYAMMNLQNSIYTLEHNQRIVMNILHAVQEVCPSTPMIFSGSAGVYENTDADYIPMNPVDCYFHSPKQVNKVSRTWLPMGANDFYHQSKVHTFGLVDMCVKMWGLKACTVQQSTIYGHSGFENDIPDACLPHFHYDSVFGTVLNRFMTQAAIGYPLTVYGDGDASTGLISLTDACRSYEKIVDDIEMGRSDMRSGEHIVEHNLTTTITIAKLAKLVSNLTGCKIQNMENPRHSRFSYNKKSMELGSYNKRSDITEDSLTSLWNFVSSHKESIHSAYIEPFNWRK